MIDIMEQAKTNYAFQAPKEIQGSNGSVIVIKEPARFDSWIVAILDAQAQELRDKIVEALKQHEVMTSDGNKIKLLDDPNFRYRESLDRLLTRELPRIDDQNEKTTLGEENPPLSEEAVQKIATGAALRERRIDSIDDLVAVTQESVHPSNTGLMGMMRDEAEAELEKKIELYEREFDEDYPQGEDLTLGLIDLPRKIGLHFDAHGIAKGRVKYQLEALLRLLSEGVDTSKTFYTMSLVEDPEAFIYGAAGPYTTGGFIIVSAPDKKILDLDTGETEIAAVIVNKHFYFAIPQLQTAFPKVKFIRSNEMNEKLTEMLEQA